MLSYITVGANDVPRSARFYTAILTPLGYQKNEAANGVEFINDPGAVYVKKPYDGKEATVGNGSMTAFQAETHQMVRDLHAAGLEAGGSDEGAPASETSTATDSMSVISATPWATRSRSSARTR